MRFCPGCGARAADGANFCVACGTALREKHPSPASRAPAVSATPAIVVLAAFLAVGLALWFAILKPEERARRPLAAKAAPGTGEVASSGQGQEERLPADHPPVRIPEEVRTFLADLEQKAEASPNDLETWKQLAQVQARAGQVDASYLANAETSWNHVLDLAPKDLDALRGLGNIHFDREDYAKAIESYEAYLTEQPEDPNVRTDLGTMYLYGGEPERAIREYESVIAADAKFFQAHFNLGVAHMRVGAREKAREAFEKARDAAPDEDTRSRIASMIQSTTMTNGGAATGDGFQTRVEQSVREHPIAGPKVVRIEWSSPTEARVLFQEFPMDAMPPFARTKFLDRLKTEISDAQKADGVEGPARLELVDEATGTVMEVVEAP